MNYLPTRLMKTGAVALASFLTFALGAEATSEGWTTDLAAAKKLAAEKKLDIFMNFTGSDW